MAARNGLVAALDVGTTKVCCFIAKIQDDGSPRMVGIGHQVARGMRNGAVVDMEELETSIRAAAEAAEEMANDQVRAVAINISGGHPGSAKSRWKLP
jgi:cell division protein FtsA